MAILTGAAVEFFGTQDTLGTSSSALSDGAFSTASDLSTFTNDDDALIASITLFTNFAISPNPNSTVNLFYRLLNVESANNNPIPDANFQHAYAGNFPANDATGDQYSTIDISLRNAYTSQQYEFYIQNETGQTITAGWDVYITPKSVGPHA